MHELLMKRKDFNAEPVTIIQPTPRNEKLLNTMILMTNVMMKNVIIFVDTNLITTTSIMINQHIEA